MGWRRASLQAFIALPDDPGFPAPSCQHISIYTSPRGFNTLFSANAHTHMKVNHKIKTFLKGGMFLLTYDVRLSVYQRL